MAFGPIMKLTTDSGLKIELAPFSREDVLIFADGLSRHSITQYLEKDIAQTNETEEEWYDKMIKDDESRVWGIWAVDGSSRRLVGNSIIEGMSEGHIHMGITGSVIVDPSLWGKGIASACHKARTMYAFDQLGLHRLTAGVIRANGGSSKALERTGYSFDYTERNARFVNGKLAHLDQFECLNPADWAWRQWWGDDRPPVKSLEARKRTEAALSWARKHVELA